MKQIFYHANVYDSVRQDFLTNAAIVCEGDRILEILPAAEQMPEGSKFDLGGKWVIPGLINLHEHQTYKRLVGPLFGPKGSFFQITDAALTQRAIRSAMYSLRMGITTILEAGAPGNIPYTMRQATAEGSVPGPRMLITGQAFSITGGHGCELCIEVDTPDEMRKGVRSSFKKGVDAIKLLSSEEPVAVSEGEPVIAEISEEMIRAAVEEAHNVHSLVSIHAMGTEQLGRSIRAGVDIINHGAFLNDALAEAMAGKGITLIPTLSSYRLTAHTAFGRGEAWSAKHKTLWPAFDEAVAAARRAGVRIAIGTDSVGDFFHEMEMLHRRGMSTAECLQAATLNGAQALKQEKNLGSIVPGKYADFVVLDANPLQDLSVLRKPVSVIKGAKRYDPARLAWENLPADVFVEAFEPGEEWM